MDKLYKKIFMVFILCCPGLLAHAQSLTGKITNQKGEALPGIKIYFQGLTEATTNNSGEFQYKFPSRGSYRLRISSDNYQPAFQDVAIKSGSQNITIALSDLDYQPEIQVSTGNRAAGGNSINQNSAPVQVITAEEMKKFAQKDITQILSYAMQSFNSNRQTIAGGTDHIDPISLRGLSPDQVLILVNGKRRHSTALVNVDGTFGRGAVGTDMNSIPVSAVERIEILRDAASAQYGSDAIGGAINIILKSNSPFNMSMSYGESASETNGLRYNDGKTFQIDYSEGISLAGRGSLNFSGQFLYRGATNRSGFDTRPLLYSPLLVKTDCECEKDFVKRYEKAKTLDDLKALSAGFSRNNMRVGNAESSNGGLLINGNFALLKNMELYLTAGYTLKNGEAAGFYRLPGETAQIDLGMYPNGYLPLINTGIQDLSVASGIRGRLLGWNYDLSHVSGKNNIDFNISQTLNASLPLGTSPDNFYAGDLYFRQNTSNLDFSRTFNLGRIFNSFTTAFGAEYRTDNYEIRAGEELSYSYGQPSKSIAARKLGSLFAEPGAQVFSGFTPVNSLNKSRNNKSAYADVETSLGSKIRLGLAARLDDYSDFGNNMSYRTSGRYNFYKSFAVRGSYSTGFRAPSLHQQYFNNQSSQFINKKATSDLIVNNDHPAVSQFGVGSLRPEKSNSVNLGFTGNLIKTLSFSADVYQINVDDRIILSGLYERERNAKGVLLPAGAVNKLLNAVDPTAAINSVMFFANAVSTETRGLDFMFTNRISLRNPGQGISLSAGLNLNRTRVEEVNASDQVNSDQVLSNQLFNRQERSRIESSIPDSKLNFTAGYFAKTWGISARTVRFGEISYKNPFDGTLPENLTVPFADQTFSPKWITDMSLNHSFTRELNFAVGVSNLFDIYPDRLYIDPNNRPDNLTGDPVLNYINSASRDNTGNGRIQYSRNATQFGFNGRHVFGKLSYSL